MAAVAKKRRNAKTNVNGRGRPRTHAKPIMVRVPPEMLAKLDKWRKKRNQGRPEAIRQILEHRLRRL